MANAKPLDHQFYKDNPVFTSANLILEFIRPLKSLDLSYFTFDRHYRDNARVSLTSSADWIGHYWSHKLYENSVFERDHAKFTDGHVLWNWLNREPVYSSAALYGIENGITIIEKYQAYSDFFHFAPLGCSALNGGDLIEKLPLLHQFSALFKSRLKTLIQTADRARFTAGPPQGAASTGNCALLTANATDRIHNTRRTYLGDEFANAYLTKKELELAILLARGCSAARAAIELEISNDTVNKHIRNIKNKLNCKTLCELGFAIGKSSARIACHIKNLGDGNADLDGHD
jgi:DNA-binding CsgD family transcriptional regulator